MEQPKIKRNFAHEMKKILLFILSTIAFSLVKAQTPSTGISPLNIVSPDELPLHEVRAVWLTTIGGLDWPHSYASSAASAERQKNELCNILDQLHVSGINTVLLQTRVRATSIFPSEMEPWDGCLSGIPGKSPGYDALAFAIEECHKRGMQLHAWVVTIPVGKWNGAGCKNLRDKYPSLLKKIGEDGYMNPEASGVADYLARYCEDLTKRYDIDGIHLDYIRYPETWGKIKDRNIGRENITSIVSAIHKAVKSLKPWVMMSCSPIGKYDDLPRQGSHGWNARQTVCQDVSLWMERGLMDAIFPMMYFKDKHFYPFAIDWQERSNGRIVVPGLGIYFMSPKEKNWPLIDITRELKVLRQYGMGHAYFRSKFFTDNTKDIYNYAKDELCPYPALVPAMKWYNFPNPEAPATLTIDHNKLSWNKGKDNSDGPYLTYNVYASDVYPVNTASAENILAVGLRDTICTVASHKYYAVTSVDRYGNESTPRQFYIPGVTGKESKKGDTHHVSDLCPVITCDKTLSKRDLTKVFPLNADKTIITLESLQGNIVMATSLSETIDVSQIEPGIYVARSVNKKKKRHRLCFVKIER